MGKHYETEREGQIAFFDNYHIPYNEDNSILIDNTDGVYKGNLLEFKLNISNPNKVLLQAIKYLSRMRIKGESVPATILLVDLNNEKAYQYTSEDYRDDIQKVYIGAASKNVEGFSAGAPDRIYDYSDQLDSSRLKKQLVSSKPTEQEFMAVDIDENCVVGWAERYYREIPNATKGDFLGDDSGQVKIVGEIREPKHFKDLIRPYISETNERFKYLMDCLNDRLSKKDLGAFYTHPLYAEKAGRDLVLPAVNRALEAGKEDYIILDRCAGTGNLEAGLIGLKDKNGDELISHCVVSTYEYYEYKVLSERLGDKVLEIIPPTEADVRYANGTVANADAMTEEYINNPIIRQYLDDENYAIILFENPPYRDVTAGLTNGVSQCTGKTSSFVVGEMKKEVKGVATNELANQFIWSGFKFYLRQPTDSYIVFSPIKYWKQYDFVTATPVKAYAYNRQYFHATDSSILCIDWENISGNCTSIKAEFYDIHDDHTELVAIKTIQRVKNPASKNYTRVKFSDDEKCTVYCSKDGTAATDKKVRVPSYRSESVIGYLEADSFSIAPLNRNLVTQTLYNGNGCYLLVNEYRRVLPIWVAKHVPLENWYEKDIYATTSDGGDAYTKDADFLKSCLIYTCLSNQNKCLTFEGSDGRHYRNELCFDHDTVASKDLAGMTLDADEQELVDLWYKILEEARATGKCNPDWTYGVYQITREINTYVENGSGKNKKRVYDYPQLNGDLETLRVKLKEYYKSHITAKMFEHELLK